MAARAVRSPDAALDGAVRWWPSVPDGLLRPAQPDPRFFIPGRGWLPELTPEGIRLISTHDPEQPPLELAAPEGVGLPGVVPVEVPGVGSEAPELPGPVLVMDDDSGPLEGPSVGVLPWPVEGGVVTS